MDLRALAEAFVTRMQFARQHGLSFRDKRNMYNVLGYDEKIQPSRYRGRYDRGGIAGRIVDVYPRATWRRGIQVVEDITKLEPENFTPFEKEFGALAKRLRLWSAFLKADILAGQGRYSVLLIGAPGDMSQELPRGKAASLAYLTAFGEDDATISATEQNTSNPRFGLPTSYQLKRTDITSSLSKPVHWTRIIHVAENALDDDVYGKPRLERVWNLLDDLDKVTGGGAEAFWLRANRGMQWDVNKEIAALSEDEKKDFRQQAEDYANEVTRIIRTRGVKINDLGSDVADFSSPADAIVTQIAGAISIPKRILVGSERGELASTQDRDNWNRQVRDRCSNFAEPVVINQTVDRLVAYGYLPAPKQYETIWPDVEELSESERAEGAKAWAAINQMNGRRVFNEDEMRDKWYGMEPREVDEDELEEEDDQVSRLEAAMRAGGPVEFAVRRK